MSKFKRHLERVIISMGNNDSLQEEEEEGEEDRRRDSATFVEDDLTSGEVVNDATDNKPKNATLGLMAEKLLGDEILKGGRSARANSF